MPALIASRSDIACDSVDTFTSLSPAGTAPAVSEQLPGRGEEDGRAGLAGAHHLLLDAADRLDLAGGGDLAGARR